MSNTNETFASQGSPNDDDSGQINLFADKTSTLGLTAPVTSPIKNGPILTKDCSNYIGGNPLVTGQAISGDNWQTQVNDRKVARPKRKEQLASISSIQFAYRVIDSHIEVTAPERTRGISNAAVKRKIKKRSSIAIIEEFDVQRLRAIIETQIKTSGLKAPKKEFDI